MMSTNKEKIVIVGAGVAGLTAASYLSRENYEVVILEKNNQSGGLVSTFDRDGFHFDTGPRAFVNSGMVKPILRDLDIEMESLENRISIAIEDKIVKIESLQSIQDYKNVLIDFFPDNVEDIERISKIVHKLSKHTEVLYELDNPFFVDYTKDLKVLFTKFIPWLIKLSIAVRAFNKYNTPMVTYLKTLTNNESLIDVITQYFFKETPSYFALGYFHVYLDYFYPSKGTGTLPQLLKEKVLVEGGTIQLNTEVVEVIPSKKIVLDSKGQSYQYDYLVWASDLKTLYKNVTVDGLTSDMKDKVLSQGKKVTESKVAESAFMMFIGVDRNPKYFKDLLGEHSFYTPSRKGLREVNRNDMQDILDNFDAKSKQQVLQWVTDFVDNNTFEVSIPVLRDETLAPQGKTGIMISCLFNYEMIHKINKAGYMDDFVNLMENRIIDLFSTNIFNGFKEDILFQFSSNPLSINKIIGSSGGGIVGWSFESEPPVHSTLKKLKKTVITPIPDVYQAGQWAYAPAGVPIAMLTGWLSYKEIVNSKAKKKR